MAAAGVLFDIAEKVLVMLASPALEEMKMLWGVKDEIRKLGNIISAIKAVLLDAEEKQATSHQVRDWLEKLQDAVYDADDLLDEFQTQAKRRRLVPGNQLTRQVRIFFSSSNQLSFRLQMGHKIRKIREALGEIMASRSFYLMDRVEDNGGVLVRCGLGRETYSFVDEEEVIGRDVEREEILQLLLESDFKEDVSIIPIVGIGGLGKTTLAQYVFNDAKVKRHFELKMWVCVSQVFEVKLVVEKIMKSVTSRNPANLELERLQIQLRQKLEGKKYLLVLDDVWNEDGEKWLKLERLLKGGARGSRVLVTTRSDMVAKITRTVPPYYLSGLSKDVSWSLFERMTFEKGQEPAKDSRIMALGMEIVKKCKGVPLVIRTIGRLLQSRLMQSQDPENEWLLFRDNELAKIAQSTDILPTLKLSYNHLPSHLKHCFAYCRLFPKDHRLDVHRLVKLWMAQGFIRCSHQNQCLEDVGYEYFMNLLWRSFFQEPEKDEWGNIVSCKMHDLMHDLAALVAGTECLIIDQSMEIFHERVRHVSFGFESRKSCQIPAFLFEQKRMRTFLLFGSHGKLSSSKFNALWSNFNAFWSKFNVLLSKFKFLRALSLAQMQLKTLPNSLGEMEHLRYLDLSNNENMDMLPSSITKLQSLQTMILCGCRSLKSLPQDFKKLLNLRHLDIRGCSCLTSMPHGLGELTSLHSLPEFVPADDDDLLRQNAGLCELNTLNNLRGELKITDLGHTKQVALESKATELKQKQHLRSLCLAWKFEAEDDGKEDIVENAETTLCGLEPHSNLRVLKVYRFRGVKFANWLSFLINLVKLELWYFKNCQYLPPLDRLPSLEELQLCGLTALEYILDEDKDLDVLKDEFTTSSSASTLSFFPSLRKLILDDLPNLKGWWKKKDIHDKIDGVPSFPSLSNLRISRCPYLDFMPLFPYIEKLYLEETSFRPVQQMIMMRNHSLEAEGRGSLSLLSTICIRRCPGLESLPKELGNLPSLKSITIGKCPNLASLPEEIGNLQSLLVISIHECSNLVSLSKSIGNLSSLQHIIIKKCPSLTSLPEGIGNLSSVQSISISDCPSLASLPEGMRRLTSLKQLIIDDCPILSQRYKREIGEDWTKIAHIPKVAIVRKWIN